jgi:amidohydrolase
VSRYERILKKASEEKQRIIELRRDFHRHPEAAFQEFATAKKVEKMLSEAGLETRMLVNGTGVVGLLRAGGGRKTIALRADMDALPVQEEADHSYKSISPGMMHACGHDAHTAMLLSAARILAEWRGDLGGNVVFLFQPAEETGEGAKKMVDEGALDGVDRIFGLHVASSLASGTVGFHPGPFMAGGDFFDATITGKGGHGGMPHLAIDPVTMAANAIVALQTIVSRETDPLESAVLSICKLESGPGTYNIIPNAVRFGGTLRYLKPELRESLPKRVEAILDGVVSAMRGRCDFTLMRRFPLMVNDGPVTEFAARVARDLLGGEKVFDMRPLMASEDFSYYLQNVPGSYLFLGTGNESGTTRFPHHHPMFDVDEDVFPVGTALHAALAMEYVNA